MPRATSNGNGARGRPGGIAGSLTISKPLLDQIEAHGTPEEKASLMAVRAIVERAKAAKRFGDKSPEDLEKLRAEAAARMSALDRAIADARSRGVPA